MLSATEIKKIAQISQQDWKAGYSEVPLIMKYEITRTIEVA